MWPFETMSRARARVALKQVGSLGGYWYVYVLYRIDNQLPFYVGKGSRDRFAHHYWRGGGMNRHTRAVISATGGDYLVQFDSFHFFEVEAYDREREVIAFLRADGYELTNATAGGLIDFSPEIRARATQGTIKALAAASHRQRLKDQARRAGLMPHCRAARSANISSLNTDPSFIDKKLRAVRLRYELRRQALNLLLANGSSVDLPANKKTGGTLAFWQDLVTRLAGAQNA